MLIHVFESKKGKKGLSLGMLIDDNIFIQQLKVQL